MGLAGLTQAEHGHPESRVPHNGIQHSTVTEQLLHCYRTVLLQTALFLRKWFSPRLNMAIPSPRVPHNGDGVAQHVSIPNPNPKERE